VRLQQTLARSVTLHGFGLFGGIDVRMELCPAPEDHGLIFQRTDLPGQPLIPAWIEFVQPQHRCTAIRRGTATVAVIEHVLAALAGLQVDNCLIRLNAPEPPGVDGSAGPFVELIDRAGIVQQEASQPVLKISEPVTVSPAENLGVVAAPVRGARYAIGYLLDCGPGPIPPQAVLREITPAIFREDLAAARTFIRYEEVAELRRQGIGLRTTAQHLLVWQTAGPLDNELRFPDECARHKLLDCIGDFALIGCDLQGQFVAQRSGHRHNHELIRTLRVAYPESLPRAFARYQDSPVPWQTAAPRSLRAA
jgi:UDP-3-O-[3-hydroxymyristoyl] N-acetylglucosamine deacetylase/UDP-3-O-[3-hydroxymyristoyl] N-acetylglucosamine deacetylase/3-hydroxyacyl-[acyl-carrier-protein] dehydratase